MNKKIKICFLIFLLFITFLFFGCSNHLYKITTYTKQPGRDYQSSTSNLKIHFADSYLPSGNYEAKKIISYDDSSVRFIDLKGNEQFISGDKVEVKEIK
jgi:hypothetical protein